MKCVICKIGETQPGKSTNMFEKEGNLMIFKDIDADICDNCGEAYFSADVTKKLQDKITDSFQKGVQLEIVKW